MRNLRLAGILEKAKAESPLSHEDILRLLETTEDQFGCVAQAARELREKYFQNKIFLYGFLYFSTFCRNDCTFCLYRKSNSSYQRYRKDRGEIISAARELADSGVHLLDLTMGEDPLYHNTPQGFAELLQIVQEIKRETQTPMMLSPGIVSQDVLLKFKAAGVDWYACYQETHNRALYSRLRIRQSYDERMERKSLAKAMGYLIEEGILTGVGDTHEDIAASILTMENMEAAQVRVMSFVPQENTPLAKWKTGSHFRELLIIAIMRLVMPDRLIPASLDVDGLRGLEQRLNSGANVVTSIIPPTAGLAGVSQSSRDIADGNRSLEKIIPILSRMHLEPATRREYQTWLEAQAAPAVCLGKGAVQCR
ncbi:methylornithine synthase PylB [Desulfitobacterium chlororespirans]|nr:methylornithine synthase PylB [Desulfitobacterium chlororespirans]